MPVQREGAFLRFHELGITSSLGLESAQLGACVAEVRKRGIRGVFGCPGLGFQEENLDFLRQLPELEQVWFWDVALKDVQGLYALSKLRYFGVHPRRPGLDFSHFPLLETMVWHPSAGDRGLTTLQALETLHIWHYKPRSKSFDGLSLPPNLERLELIWANPPSTAGLPYLPSLRRLEFSHCRNLTSLDGLAASAPNLQQLIVSSSKHLVPVPAQFPPGLTLATVNGKRLI